MYDRDYDDYDYQQSRMEFAGPDDYYFESMMRSWGPRFDEYPPEFYDISNPNEDNRSTEKIIVDTVAELGNSNKVSSNLKPKYFKFLKNYGIRHCFELEDIKNTDNRLLVVLYKLLIKQFGIMDWIIALSPSQLDYIRKNIDKFYLDHASIERMIILDHVDYDNPEELFSLPKEVDFGFNNYLLRNATKNDLEKASKVLPEVARKDFRAYNLGKSSRSGAVEYIFRQTATIMSENVKQEFLFHVLQNVRKDVSDDGRHLNMTEITWLDSLLALAGVDYSFLKANFEKYVNGIYETLFRKALSSYLENK